MSVLKAGCLAHWETLRALVPCKVLSVARMPNGDMVAKIVLTADRTPYRKGEAHSPPTRHVIPRGALHLNRGSAFPTIFPYTIEEDQP